MTKQVKTVTHQPLMPVKTGITQHQLLDELHYQQSRQVITKLLNKGLISEKEFKQIDQLNQQSFPPLIGSENVDTSTIQS
ncbi:SHOCT domain-containing protein [Lactobacillaceae bacterium 24-114]